MVLELSPVMMVGMVVFADEGHCRRNQRGLRWSRREGIIGLLGSMDPGEGCSARRKARFDLAGGCGRGQNIDSEAGRNRKNRQE